MTAAIPNLVLDVAFDGLKIADGARFARVRSFRRDRVA